jgi:hypothetical protein
MLATLMIAAVLLAPQKPADPKPAEKKGVSSRLTLSTDSSLQDRWFHCPGEMGIKLPEATTVVRQQTLFAYVFFSHWSTRLDGTVDVDYDVRIKRPNGGLYTSEELLRGHMGSVGEDENILLCDQVFDVAFAADAPLGDYVVIATLRDNAGQTISKTEKTISLVDYADGLPVDDPKKFESWMKGYFQNPEPLRAIATLCALGHAGFWKDAQLPSTSTGFFAELFATNTWLVPRLLEKYDVQEPETKRLILWLLAQSFFDGKEFVAKLHGADKEAWEKLQAETRHYPLLDPIMKPAHVDQLWGVFFASGKFAAIQKLADALAPERTEAIGEGADKEALQKVVSASLRTYARNELLVHGYCEWITTNEAASDGVREALKKALGN